MSYLHDAAAPRFLTVSGMDTSWTPASGRAALSADLQNRIAAMVFAVGQRRASCGNCGDHVTLEVECTDCGKAFCKDCDTGWHAPGDRKGHKRRAIEGFDKKEAVAAECMRQYELANESIEKGLVEHGPEKLEVQKIRNTVQHIFVQLQRYLHLMQNANDPAAFSESFFAAKYYVILTKELAFLTKEHGEKFSDSSGGTMFEQLANRSVYGAEEGTGSSDLSSTKIAFKVKCFVALLISLGIGAAGFLMFKEIGLMKEIPQKYAFPAGIAGMTAGGVGVLLTTTFYFCANKRHRHDTHAGHNDCHHRPVLLQKDPEVKDPKDGDEE